MTSPERKVNDWLTLHGIPKESQKRFRIGFVDFYLPEMNAVLEVDGDYWHSFPKQILKDKARDAYLKKIGIRVFRVKEKDINADIDSAMSVLS